MARLDSSVPTIPHPLPTLIYILTPSEMARLFPTPEKIPIEEQVCHIELTTAIYTDRNSPRDIDVMVKYYNVKVALEWVEHVKRHISKTETKIYERLAAVVPLLQEVADEIQMQLDQSNIHSEHYIPPTWRQGSGRR
ncbi:hypothetical protein QCA50_016557 [Cerrena zonata]|uniref:Uncharacterized protein n=1 Tax=Cerrena zonata TaxID=2478898 RepID=A0AAW0FJB6_9APHY